MLTPEQLAHCADDVVALYSELNEEIVRDIARRVAKASDVTPTGRLQILALQDKELACKLKDFRKGLADAAAKDGIDIKF